MITKLSNNIEFAHKKSDNTPRVTLCLNFAITTAEKLAGVYVLMARLLLQGTKNRTSEQIARELDMYAIEFAADLKQDYLRFKFTALNEDFDKALELMEDIIKNSTFEEFEKEVAKTKGEIIAKLDNPRVKAVDNFYKTIFKNHYYGNTSACVLNNLDNITKEDVIAAYNNLLNNSKKVCAFVGDLEFESVFSKLEEKFSTLPNNSDYSNQIPVPGIQTSEVIEEVKADLNQAHIIKGWLTPTFEHEDYPSLLLLNVILGASGLSSRLFLELRDKKGLAYVVRSSFEPYALCGNFCIYIATEPKNLEVSLKGFEEEIQKIKNIPVSEEELENAKNNIFGKWAFSLETNNQQACLLAHYGINNLGFEFREKLVDRIKAVSVHDIQTCANKYFTENFVTSILRP